MEVNETHLRTNAVQLIHQKNKDRGSEYGKGKNE